VGKFIWRAYVICLAVFSVLGFAFKDQFNWFIMCQFLVVMSYSLILGTLIGIIPNKNHQTDSNTKIEK